MPPLARTNQKGIPMKQRKIFITEFDKKRLDDLIEAANEGDEDIRDDLRDLAKELDRASVVESTKVPADVVTMNSTVVLHDVDSSEEETYTLVFPREANGESGKISILAPIGTAILGYRVGRVVEWPVPAGVRRIRIEKILYQPEAAGDFSR